MDKSNLEVFKVGDQTYAKRYSLGLGRGGNARSHIDDLHYKLVGLQKRSGRGVLLLNVGMNGSAIDPDCITISQHTIDEFIPKSPHADLVEHNQKICDRYACYDIAKEYCTMFMFRDNIYSTAFVPFKKPEEFEQALVEAASTYREIVYNS